MTMPATVRSLPSDETHETIDFLRRLASMMSGGRNAEMLLAAAGAIETLSLRATTAEALLQELQDDHGRNVEQREVAELASDNLLAELNALKAHVSQSQSQAESGVAALKLELADHQQQSEAEIASLRLQLVESQQEAEAETASLRTQLAESQQAAEAETASLRAQLTESRQGAESEIASLRARLAESRQDADAEIASLRAQLADKDGYTQDAIAALQADIEQRDRLAEIDRRVFTEEAERLRAQIQYGEHGLTNMSAATEQAISAIDESLAVVPVQGLQLARTQFGYLAKAFEKSGDVISLTMCEIGAQALDKALAGATD